MSKFLTPQARKTLYLMWMGLGPILALYGVNLPGGKDPWDQIVYTILGIGSLGVGALATKHLPPPPAAPDTNTQPRPPKAST